MKNLKKQIQTVVDIYKSGDLLHAETLGNELLRTNPKVVFLYNLLGLISVGQDKIEKALDFYEKGIQIDPNFAMIYNNLGLLFFHNKSDFKKAEDYYKKSISLNQKTPEPHNNLGSLYNAINEIDKAILCYKKSIDVDSKFVHAYHNLGNIYITIGNFEEAKNFFFKAVNINPNYSNSHRSLSRLINYTKNDKHFSDLKNIYKSLEKLDNEHRTNIGFALGKAYEDIKDYDNSFFYYNEANIQHRKKINFSIDKEKKKFQEIKNTYNKKLFDKFKNDGNLDASPIFIVGMPRSGTTLLEQILSNHSKVYGADEVEYIPQLIKKNFGDNNLSLFFEEAVNFNKEELKKIGQEYIQKMKKTSNNAERYTDKLPKNFLSIGFIRLILPHAKIIHCFRNSKDNCLSLFKNHFPGGKINFAYDFTEIVNYYKLYQDLMNFWNTLIPSYIYNIKYENLIAHTRKEIEMLLKFCSLKWDSNCLNFHNNKKPIRTASDTQARKKIYNSSVDAWKDYEKFLKKFFKLIN